jgi:hypothetical protein
LGVQGRSKPCSTVLKDLEEADLGSIQAPIRNAWVLRQLLTCLELMEIFTISPQML